MVHQIKSKAELAMKIQEAGTKLVVIDFFALWCGPCKRIAPFLETLQEKNKDKLVMLKVDVDEVEELVSDYKIDVMPTFVLIKNQQKVGTLAGSSEEKLQALIDEHL